jgi:hypothetical protein
MTGPSSPYYAPWRAVWGTPLPPRRGSSWEGGVGPEVGCIPVYTYTNDTNPGSAICVCAGQDV